MDSNNSSLAVNNFSSFVRRRWNDVNKYGDKSGTNRYGGWLVQFRCIDRSPRKTKELTRHLRRRSASYFSAKLITNVAIATRAFFHPRSGKRAQPARFRPRRHDDDDDDAAAAISSSLSLSLSLSLSPARCSLLITH